MADMVQIRSVKQFFNEFIAEPAQKNGIEWLKSHAIRIKTQLVDAFRKEMFGQIVFKLGPEAATMTRDDLANIDMVKNILVQTFRKWKRLCILCGEMGVPIISLEDLEDALKEDEAEDGHVGVIQDPRSEEDVTDKMDELLPPGEKPVYMDEDHDSDQAEPVTSGYMTVVDEAKEDPSDDVGIRQTAATEASTAL